jgi:hypothetical protein
MSRRAGVFTVVALGLLAGCAAGSENEAGVVADEDVAVDDKPAAEKDVGFVEGFDGGFDAGVDAPADRGAPPADAGADLGADLGADDVGADLGLDAGPLDAGCVAVCNGSCTNTDTDPRNCGACGQDCALRPGVDPARVTCARGACVLGSVGCLPGRGDCNGVVTDGCEALLNSAARCGSCVESCREPTPNCGVSAAAPSGYACVSGCVAPSPTRCGTSCVNTDTDARNCGACGNVCPAGGAGATAACVGGRCALTCVAGYGDCDGVPANGCEVLVRSSASHCGACGNTCSGGANATAVCVSSACALTCASGYGNCDAVAANGCETDTRASASNCGGCGRVCAAGANATAACTAGVCSLVCAAGFGNCDALASNGCEANLNTSATACGACGRRCAAAANATATCSGGVCGIACNAGYGDCDGNGLTGCEVSFAIDANHCGGCGMRCPAAANATGACVGSRCGFACAAGFGDCDGVAANGCETPTTTSLAHCGACGRACNAPANATSACVASACVVTCDPGYTLSGAVCVRTPPAAVSPGAFSFSTSQTPTFRVALPPGQDGALVEVCRDRACTMVAGTVILTGASGVGNAILAPGTYFWRASGRVAGATVSLPGTPTLFYVAAAQRPAVGAAWGAVLDANADGSPELLVGAPGVNQARLYPGTTAGISTSYSTLPGGASYGTSVAALGDVNGDGYADAAVGEPGTNRVYLYLGRAAGLNTVPTVLQFGASVAGAGDVNGDGYADLLVGAPMSNRAFVYLGGAAGIAATAVGTSIDAIGTPSNYGVAVAGLGDVNADGFADVAVGTNGSNNVYVALGSAAGLRAATVLGAPGGASGFGFAVAAAGDVTGDGYPDAVVGAYSAGTAYVFAGGPSGLAATPAVTLGVPGGAVQFGWSVDGLGDVNGDGYGDVLVGAPGADRAYLFQGSAAGLAVVPSQTYAPTAGGAAAMGRAVARLGDINRDGVFDFALGLPTRYTVTVYRGGVTPVLAQTFLYSTTTSQFGSAFAR